MKGAELKTISEKLIEYIKAIKEDIDRDKFCTLIFKIKNGEVVRYEKTHSINLNEIKIEITK
ncbi:hypothetical protein ES703_02503 [subsurface metagenome]